MAGAVKQADVQPEKKPEKTVPERAGTPEESSHIQRLLKAKRKAADNRQDENTEE